MNTRILAVVLVLLTGCPILGGALENSRRIEELLVESRARRENKGVKKVPDTLVLKPPDLRRLDLRFFDAYDWYGDGYFAGWKSKEFDLIVRVFAEDRDNTIIRANFR